MTNTQLLNTIRTVLGTLTLSIGFSNFTYSLTTKQLQHLIAVLTNSTLFSTKTLTELVCTDKFQTTARYELNYLLLSVKKNNRWIVTTTAAELQTTRSITNLFPNAGWLEREVWEMYGVAFTGNNNLKRLLTDYGFTGFPLKKDFPLSGFEELFFNEKQNIITSATPHLSHYFRQFTTLRPW